MKKALLAILLTASCSSGGGQAGPSAETEFETKIATSIAFDPALLRQGDRVVYFVKRSGETQTQKHSWAAVSDEGATLWIENNVPFDGGRMVSKTKIDRSGKVLEQWVGEPGGIPGQRYSSAQAGPAPRPVRDSSTAKADSKEEPDRVVVGGEALRLHPRDDRAHLSRRAQEHDGQLVLEGGAFRRHQDARRPGEAPVRPAVDGARHRRPERQVRDADPAEVEAVTPRR